MNPRRIGLLKLKRAVAVPCFAGRTRGANRRRNARANSFTARDLSSALMIRQAIPPERKLAVRHKPRSGPVMEFIDEILRADQLAPRKQRHTAHRIWERIRQEHSDTVAEATLAGEFRSALAELARTAWQAFRPAGDDRVTHARQAARLGAAAAGGGEGAGFGLHGCGCGAASINHGGAYRPHPELLDLNGLERETVQARFAALNLRNLRPRGSLRYLVLTGVPDDSRRQIQTRQASPTTPIAEHLRASIHRIRPRRCFGHQSQRRRDVSVCHRASALGISNSD
jgi:hypothetical protein